jgi:hypothetical protein
MKREQVYILIDDERDYQDKKWGVNKLNSLEEWLVYIEDYLNETKHLLSRTSNSIDYDKAKCNIRKIAAMAVCALEQHTAISREQEEK